MKTCLNLSAAFQSAEEMAMGKAALLRRLHLMQMPVEEFVKKARLEEGLLSPASLQIQCQPQGDNAWNRSQHELGQANRAASVLQTRLARAQHWAQAQKTFCENVQRANPRTTAEEKGLAAVEFYHPERGDGKHQVVALNYDNRVQVGLVMSCFRGCSVRKKGQAQVQVRASKMFAGHLPASSTKLLHVARLQYDKTHNEFTVSLAEQCWAMDPVATVLGELSVLQATRLHVRLSEAAHGALEGLGRATLPKVPAMPAGPAEPVATVAPEPADSTLLFTDRSFSKANMPSQVIKFFQGLERDFREAGSPFVTDSGMVSLHGNRQCPWESLLQRIPTLLFASFDTLQGYRFSQAVHRQLVACLPSKGSLALDVVTILP